MSLELALIAIAEGLQAVAASNIKAAEIYAGGRNTTAGANTAGVKTDDDTAAADTTVAADKKPAPKKPTPKKPVETPVEPDPEKEPGKEEEVEKPRKEINAEALKDEIRAVFTKLSEKSSDLPMGVLKAEGHTRLSLVKPEDLPALLLAAKDALKSTTPDYE